MDESMPLPSTSTLSETLSKTISPGEHAVLDYAVAGTFFAVSSRLRGTHSRASKLAFLNGAMVLAMSLLTDYPGGVLRVLSFRRAHRTGDAIQAALAGLGPVLFGFASDQEARFFFGQAVSEAAVISATDWNAPV